MTDPGPTPLGAARLAPASPAARKPGRAPRPPRFTTTVLAVVVLFTGTLTFLGWQVKNGQDPALGAGKPVATAPPTRHILIRKVQRKVIVTIIKPAPEAVATGSAPSGGGSAPASSYSAPAQSYSAPAPVYSAPAPAPAPAPATSSSGG